MALIRSGCIRSMRVSSNQISPSAGRTSPEIARSVVVLPAPFAPISVTISPSATPSVMSRIAATFS